MECPVHVLEDLAFFVAMFIIPLRPSTYRCLQEHSGDACTAKSNGHHSVHFITHQSFAFY